MSAALKIVKSRGSEADRQSQPESTTSEICEWCGDTGLIAWFIDQNGTEAPIRFADVMPYRADYNYRESAMACPCVPRKRAQARLAAILGDTGPKSFYKNFTFETWDALPPAAKAGKTEARDLAGEFAKGLFEYKGKKRYGLILSGDTGSTKTGLATCVLREWLMRGEIGVWMDFADLIDAIKETYNERSAVSTAQLIGDLVQSPFLLLDDLGEGRGAALNEHSLNILWRVLNGRYAALKPTIITTNLDWTRFCKALDEALAYRLNQVYQWVEVGGQNLRKKG